MECPHCGHDDGYDDDYWDDWEPTEEPKPYWQEHPIRFARIKVRNFWRYTILRKKRPILLSQANDLLKEIYLPALRDQLNGTTLLEDLRKDYAREIERDLWGDR